MTPKIYRCDPIRDDSNSLYQAICREEAYRREREGMREYRPPIERRPAVTLAELDARSRWEDALLEAVVIVAAVMVLSIVVWVIL